MPKGSKTSAASPEPRPSRDEAVLPALLTVEEAAALLRIGRNTCYEMVRQQRIPHVRLGRLIRVPRQGLEHWISREAHLPPDPPVMVSSLPQRH